MPSADDFLESVIVEAAARLPVARDCNGYYGDELREHCRAALRELLVQMVAQHVRADLSLGDGEYQRRPYDDDEG